MPAKRIWPLVVLALGLAVGTWLCFHDFGSSSAGHYWTPSPGVERAPAPVSWPTPPTVTFSQAQLQSNAQVQLLKTRADEILAGLKKKGENMALNFAGPVSFQPTSGRTSGTGYSAPQVDLASPDHAFTFVASDNSFYSYSNRRAYELDQGKDIVPTASPDTPQWEEEQAVQISSSYLLFLCDAPGLVTFKPSKATYDHPTQYDHGPRYYAGKWTVSWVRQGPEGVPYAGNGARLEISEKWGLTSAVVWLDGTYVEQKGKRMSAKIAIKIAKHSHPAMGTPSSDIVDYTVTSCDLVYVQPYGHGGNSWRLAYVIWLRPKRILHNTSGLRYNDSQEVTVDALTGQILGNNAMM